MLELFPEGFEEQERAGGIELAAYTDAEGARRLREAFGAVESVAVADDWPDRWREFHRPVRTGPFWVGPPWERAPNDAIAVVIDPGRAFGTGAHPTTRLCLDLLASVAPSGALVDVGCGSGVLAIAGVKLGFGPVVALDSDPAAVEATLANAERNAVRLEVRLADALADPLPVADAVLANLTRADVEALALRLAAPRLIASGYRERDAVAPSGFQRRERRAAEGWAADLFERLA